MHLKTPDGQLAVVVGGSVPAEHDGWMWDLTVPGNNDHDFYVLAAQTGGNTHVNGAITGSTPVLVHNDSCGADGLESKPNAVARATGYSVKQIKEAIHGVKGQGGWRGIGGNTNPDILIDPKTGEVYPQTPDGSPGDSIGNIFDYLPEEP